MMAPVVNDCDRPGPIFVAIRSLAVQRAFGVAARQFGDQADAPFVGQIWFSYVRFGQAATAVGFGQRIEPTLAQPVQKVSLLFRRGSPYTAGDA